MVRHFLLILAIASFLSGCCRDTRSFVQRSAYAASHPDGLPIVAVPRPHFVKLSKSRKSGFEVPAANGPKTPDNVPSEDELAKMTPYSKEWVAALEAINRAAEEKLNQKLVICRGCLPPPLDDQPGSIDAPGQMKRSRRGGEPFAFGAGVIP
ncbi:hypothetical protein FXB40_26600 [Bradyrhizobium rifense]|uniref:Uncharacterized protein n=1 Tax=Bradyrhizobium rifense TaxID=515499 RepID=A0A5D3KCV3_9BRAD|nr:hypothetical protein [Bradyrhizobium rifense]TYL92019.1 hypothetical protein FXB40_26600 [Bradyrhizobium rifense]